MIELQWKEKNSSQFDGCDLVNSKFLYLILFLGLQNEKVFLQLFQSRIQVVNFYIKCKTLHET